MRAERGASSFTFCASFTGRFCVCCVCVVFVCFVCFLSFWLVQTPAFNSRFTFFSPTMSRARSAMHEEKKEKNVRCGNTVIYQACGCKSLKVVNLWHMR